jgi:lysophospholipase L1-like esterase
VHIFIRNLILISSIVAIPSFLAAEGENAVKKGNAPKTYLALGDSYTIGESVAEKDRWPVQLAKLLKDKGVDIADPQIIARTGWTTDELSAAMDKADLKAGYSLVTLLIGVNNQFRGRGSDEYRKEFTALLKRAIDLAGGDASHVIVVSIPDYGVTPFGQRMNPEKIAKEIDKFNAIAKEETEKAKAPWVDITPGSREAAKDKELVARDGLHPSGKMYAEWSAAAFEKALKALK